MPPLYLRKGSFFVQKMGSTTQVVIDEWIETAKELGRPIPEPKGRLLFA